MVYLQKRFAGYYISVHRSVLWIEEICRPQPRGEASFLDTGSQALADNTMVICYEHLHADFPFPAPVQILLPGPS
jgi:hypothetical protein